MIPGSIKTGCSSVRTPRCEQMQVEITGLAPGALALFSQRPRKDAGSADGRLLASGPAMAGSSRYLCVSSGLWLGDGVTARPLAVPSPVVAAAARGRLPWEPHLSTLKFPVVACHLGHL